MLVLDKNDLRTAANLIKNGGLVAIPTETVYGLAANALDGNAVAKIFQAKGRPQDNPLIVHVSNIKQVETLTLCITEKARLLIYKFWPGPLTIILPKSGIVPDAVSAGLDTVAIRMPSHSVAREIINLSGVPLAAPSANRSGRPSPTCISHVIQDMDGRIDAIVDGGNCSVGIESTVIDLSGEKPRLLRPGAVTDEEIMDVIDDIEIDDAVYNKLPKGVNPSSPGMKYKHYAPKAQVIMVNGNRKNYVDFVKRHFGEGVYALCYDEDIPFIEKNFLSYGKQYDYAEQAGKLFNVLRQLDELGARVVYAHAPEPKGIGLAVYNRLVRAAGFNIVNL